MVADWWRKGKRMLQKVPRDVLYVLVLVFSCTASFGFGILAGKELAERELIITYPAETGAVLAPEGGKYMASRNGSRYHLPECSGAKNIAEGNRVWFASKEEAEGAGYTPAANCPGI